MAKWTPEYEKQFQHEYWENHKKELSAYRSQWDKANRERTRLHKNELAAERRKKNPDKQREYEIRYRKNHAEQLRKKAREYKEKYPDRVKEARQKRREQNREYHRENVRQLRSEVITAYGGECICCGEKHIAFLTIDHINNNGKEDRKENGSGIRFYRWLKKNGFTKNDLQVLCYNCNCCKQHDPEGHVKAHPKALSLFGSDGNAKNNKNGSNMD